MREQLQSIDQAQTRSGFVFSCVPAAGMLMLLAIASLTSTQAFNELYQLVTGYLWLSKTSLSVWLLAHPGVGHLLSYALLSLSLSAALPRQEVFIAPLAAVTFGLLLEIAQIFIATRDASWMDIGLNVLGVAVGFGVYLLWVGKSKVDPGSSPG